MSEPIYDAS